MLPDTALKDMKPLFLTPCYGANVTTTYANSLLALNNALWGVGMSANIRMRAGESLVTRARNEAVAEFLADRSYTHLFWIDADIGFTPEAAFRLLRADRDVAAGAYPLKRIAWPDVMPAGLSRDEFLARHTLYPVNASNGKEPMPLAIDADGFMEVSEAPTGFMAIKRSVFDTMIARLPDLQYVPDGPPHSPLHGHCYRFFDVMVEPETNRYLSEDYAFCRRWRDIGGKIHIDTQSRLRHQGVQTFEGDYAETLRVAPNNACGGLS